MAVNAFSQVRTGEKEGQFDPAILKIGIVRSIQNQQWGNIAAALEGKDLTVGQVSTHPYVTALHDVLRDYGETKQEDIWAAITTAQTARGTPVPDDNSPV